MDNDKNLCDADIYFRHFISELENEVIELEQRISQTHAGHPDLVAYFFQEINNVIASEAKIKKISPALDKDAKEIIKLVIAISKIGDARIIPPFIDLLGNHYQEVRSIIGFLLVSKFSSEVITPLTKVIQSEDEDYTRQCAALITLAHTHDPQVIPILVAAHTEEWVESELTTFALGIIGKQAIPYLLDTLTHENADTRFCAIRQLGKLGGKEIIARLEEVQQTDDGEAWLGHTIRQAASEAIAQIKDRTQLKG